MLRTLQGGNGAKNEVIIMDEERKSAEDEDREGEEGDRLMINTGPRVSVSSDSINQYFQPIVGTINALDQMPMKK